MSMHVCCMSRLLILSSCPDARLSSMSVWKGLSRRSSKDYISCIMLIPHFLLQASIAISDCQIIQAGSESVCILLLIRADDMPIHTSHERAVYVDDRLHTVSTRAARLLACLLIS